MSHFAMLCVPAKGRLFPMLAIARALLASGHRVTLIGRARMASEAQAAEVDFVDLDSVPFDGPSLDQHRTSAIRRFLPSQIPRWGSGEYAEASGLRAVAISIEAYRRWAAFDLDRVPTLLDRLKVDALVVSESSLAASTIAESRGLPFITISTGLPRHETGSLPPEFLLWRHRDAAWARSRNEIMSQLRRLLDLPTLDMLNHVRRQAALPLYTQLSDTRSPLATISQLPPGLDFPVPGMEKPVHYVGPIVSPGSREETPFPWERLTGEPIVYASAGTMSAGREYFRCIGEACKGKAVQLVVTRGGGEFPALDGSLPDSAVVVDYAPQLELLERASLVITHGSVNTVTESLLHGLPLIVIPLVFDQPGMAARVVRSGAGVAMSLKRAATSRLSSAIDTLLGDARYPERAGHLREICQASGGVSKAVDIIEAATIGKAPSSDACG